MNQSHTAATRFIRVMNHDNKSSMMSNHNKSRVMSHYNSREGRRARVGVGPDSGSTASDVLWGSLLPLSLLLPVSCPLSLSLSCPLSAIASSNPSTSASTCAERQLDNLATCAQSQPDNLATKLHRNSNLARM